MTGRRSTPNSDSRQVTRTWTTVWLLVACASLASGCVGGGRSRNPFPEIESSPLQSAAQTTDTDANTSDAPVLMTSAQTTPSGGEVQPQTQPTFSPGVEADLQAIAQMDPDAYQQLIAERAQYKPSLWPGVVRHRRSTLAYRRQLAGHEQPSPAGNPWERTTIPDEHLLARQPPAASRAPDEPQPVATDSVALQQFAVYPPTDARQAAAEIGQPVHAVQAAHTAVADDAQNVTTIQPATHLAPASNAAARLDEQAPLGVNNLALCSEVTSFGVYTQFDPPRFAAGDQVLVYAEIENYRSDATDQGYHTALAASYTILDSNGHRVDSQQFPLVNDYCRNPRRDFFVRYFVTLPTKIAPGSYTLELLVEDTKSHKRGRSTVPLEIGRETRGPRSEFGGQ